MSRSLRLLSAIVALISIGRPAEACPRDEHLEGIAIRLLLGEVETSPEALDAALRASGSTAIEASALVSRSEERLLGFERDQRARRGGEIRCGRADGEGTFALVISGRGVDLAVRDGKLHASLGPDYPRATLVARTAEGDLVWENLSRGDLAEGVSLRDLGLRAPLPELQLLVDDPDGPRPIARLPGIARARPRLYAGEEPRALVHRIRNQRRLAPLRDSGILDREAKEHAQTTCVSGRLAHRSESGDPEERLRGRGIVARVVGEALAKGSTRDAALRALLESPSHLATIEDARFTDLGVGVARGERGICVVLLFASFPRYIPPPRRR